MFVNLSKKFGKLRIKVAQNILFGSNKKILWVCNCGRETLAKIQNVTNGNTKSCGRCNEIPAQEMARRKFGKLRIKTPQIITTGSNKKVEWICDCGRRVITQINLVTRGNSLSCGRCNEIPAQEIATRKFGKLRIKNPRNIKPGSHGKIEWICDCGRETIAWIKCVVSGQTKTCGHCNEISADAVSKMKFGKLRIKHPQDTMPGSAKRVLCVCDCGKEVLAITQFLFKGATTSCGKCRLILASEIAQRKFGKLRIKIPQDVMPGSAKKITWICDCGNEKLISIDKVISGHTSSCGNCREIIHDWYIKNKYEIKSLKYPIHPEDVPPGGIVPLEIIKKFPYKFKTLCPACQKPWTGYFNDIKLGKSLTCGCATYRISGPQREIAEFIKSFGFDVKLEYELGAYKYDVFVPAINTLIEYDGSKWHNSHIAVVRDLKKHKLAVESGYKFMRISEKDWLHDNQDTRDRIKCHLGLN